MELTRYYDLLANVRHDGELHSITDLVQPNDPEVQEVAQVLHQADDFVKACQDFVDSFTTYRREIGDYWATPAEILQTQAGDCDDKAILLVSLLRNYIAAEDVFCAFGLWFTNGKPGGHMWVIMSNGQGEDRIIEATASSEKPEKGKYILQALFNDQYALSYPAGIKNFDLVPVTAVPA